MNDDPLSLAIKELEVEAYQHGLRSGNRKRGDDDLFRTSHGAPQHAARDRALAIAERIQHVVNASVALYRCNCDAPDPEMACFDERWAWDLAMEEYTQATDPPAPAADLAPKEDQS